MFHKFPRFPQDIWGSFMIFAQQTMFNFQRLVLFSWICKIDQPLGGSKILQLAIFFGTCLSIGSLIDRDLSSNTKEKGAEGRPKLQLTLDIPTCSAAPAASSQGSVLRRNAAFDILWTWRKLCLLGSSQPGLFTSSMIRTNTSLRSYFRWQTGNSWQFTSLK